MMVALSVKYWHTIIRMSVRPIFYDPKGRRSLYVNIAIAAAGFLALSAVCVLILGVIIAPDLPRFDKEVSWKPELPQDRHPKSPYNPQRAPTTNYRQLLRLAYVTGSQGTSLSSLKRNVDKLDAVIIQSASLDKNVNKGIGIEFDSFLSPHIRWLATSAPRVDVYPQLTIPAVAQVAAAMATPLGRANLIRTVVGYIAQNNFAGIVVHFEDVPDSMHRNFVSFLMDLRTALPEHAGSLLVSIGSELPSSRLQQLARPARFFVLNTYDQGCNARLPGPIEPHTGFEQRLARHSAMVGPDKLIVAIGSFGCEWQAGLGKLVPVQHAYDEASRHGGKIVWDSKSLNPVLLSRDESGARQLWFLDGASAFNEMRSALSFKAAGIAIW